MRREVYGTSGTRILLWFDLLPGESDERPSEAQPMGSELATREVPRFRVRAVGSFEQLPGCPDYAVRGLAPDRLERLCQEYDEGGRCLRSATCDEITDPDGCLAAAEPRAWSSPIFVDYVP